MHASSVIYLHGRVRVIFLSGTFISQVVTPKCYSLEVIKLYG